MVSNLKTDQLVVKFLFKTLGNSRTSLNFTHNFGSRAILSVIVSVFVCLYPSNCTGADSGAKEYDLDALFVFFFLINWG